MRIEQPPQPSSTQSPLAGHAPARKILGTATNARTAGFIPVWKNAPSPQNTIEHNIQSALNASTIRPTDNTLAFTAPQASGAETTSSFGFGDLLDMINPLQHLPVVGHLYREFTGDTIRPIGQIIGGGLFAGPLGAAGGLLNAIVQEETGKDVTGNAFAMMFDGKAPHLKSNNNDAPQNDLVEIMPSTLTPETSYSNDDIGQLLALSDLKSDAMIQIMRSPNTPVPTRT